MAQAWPAGLQELLSEANFGIQDQDTVIRSEMDVGYAKVRRRFTKGISTFSGSIYLTTDEYTLFKDFFDTTLNGGAIPFTYNHPITQVPSDFRFKGAPAYSSIGGGNFTVQFVWELLP